MPADASQSGERQNPQDLRLLLPLGEVHKLTGFAVRSMKDAHKAGNFPAITFRGHWYTWRGFVDSIFAAVRSGRVASVEEIGRAWIDGIALQGASA